MTTSTESHAPLVASPGIVMNYRCLLYLAINLGFLTACSSIQKSSSIVRPRLSIEDILKIPLAQGEAGRRQIVSQLLEVAKYPNPPGAKLGTSTLRHPITLQDGYRIMELYDYANSDRVSLSIDRTPCFKLSTAIEYTGAKLIPVLQAYTLYDTYSILKDGAEISFGTPNPKDECIASIHIGPGFSNPLSIEDILEIPLVRGEAGWLQIVTRLFDMANYPNPLGSKYGANILRSPLALNDGTMVVELRDFTRTGKISLLIDRNPCFKLQRAIDLTDAEMMPVLHGYTLYDTYSIAKSGVQIEFGTQNPKDVCVVDIHIHKITNHHRR